MEMMMIVVMMMMMMMVMMMIVVMMMVMMMLLLQIQEGMLRTEHAHRTHNTWAQRKKILKIGGQIMV